MKKTILKSTVLFLIMAFSLSSFAQDIYLMGNITTAEGDVVPNHEVMITSADSSFYHVTLLTNDAGDYSVTINNDNNYLEALVVETLAEECYSFYSEYVILDTNLVEYEVNFVLCDSMQNDCFVDFFYYSGEDDSLTLNFEGIAQDSMYNWTWNFGDNTTGTGQTISHSYETEGEYLVTVSATSDACDTITSTQYVYIDASPWEDTTRCFADFYYMLDSLNEQTVTFYDASLGMNEITSWEWDFGDGTTGIGEVVEHTYSDNEEYVVTLTISVGDICNASWEEVVWFGENTWYPEDCQALFFANYDFENYKNVSFEDISWGAYNKILAWEWNFGDGETSNLQNPTHSYDADGEYGVTLTIFTNSCSNTFEQVIYIENYQWSDCQAMFFPEFLTDLEVQFFNLTFPVTEENYWEFGDGTTSTEASPLHQYSEEGIYFVTLYTEIDSCFSAFEMEFQIGNDNSKLVSKIIRAYAITNEESPLMGIEETNKINLNTTISCYPNPVTNNLNIDLDVELNEVNITIYNISGQQVFVGDYTNNSIKINTENFESGLYVAKIMIDGKISSVKFVK